MTHKVSVVINTLNENPKYLYEAIRSCIRQHEAEVQVILSTVKGDPCLALGKQFGLKVIENDHPGIYYQLNNALPFVTGDWFFVFGGNDIALPNKCRQEIECCVERARICYSDFVYIDAASKVTGYAKAKPYDYKDNLTGQFFYDDAMIHRSILDRFVPFREEFGNCAYWDFWLRVAEQCGPQTFAYCPKPGIQYRMLASSQHIRRKKDTAAKAKYEIEKALLRKVHGG